MKTTIKISLLFLLSTFLFSCIDDSITSSDTDIENYEAIQLKTINGNNKSSSGYSFLKFKNQKIFNKTIADLANEAENYDNSFIASYPELSGESLTEKEIEIGFNHYSIFEKFIKKYNFKNSMLNSYISEESEWLANENLDIKSDPGIKYLELEPEEMVLLNEDGVVQIGDDIYIQAQNGYVTIPENNTEGLFSYLDGFDFSGIGPITIGWADLGFDFSGFSDWTENNPTYNCSDDDTKTSWWNYNSTRKIKGVVKSHNSWMGGVYLKSKTVYYRRYWCFGYHWIQTRYKTFFFPNKPWE